MTLQAMNERKVNGQRRTRGATWLRVESDWPNAKLRASERWSRLDARALDEIDGARERLAEELRDVYGFSHDEANEQIDEFADSHWGEGTRH